MRHLLTNEHDSFENSHQYEKMAVEGVIC